MPFLGVLPEREALFQPQPVSDVGVNDVEAWRLNPKHRQDYNKLELARSQGLTAAPCDVSPESLGVSAETPVFVKPITNLAGMSLGARIVAAGEVHAEEGSFWCELLAGQQTSTDCLLHDGKVVWFAHTQAADERNKQRPIYWQIGVELPQLEPTIRSFLEARLEGYTGLCNLEMVDGRVIEVHLRGSNAFFDFYGPAFIESWVALVDRNVWNSPGTIPGGVVYSVFSERPIALDLDRLQREYPNFTIQPDRQVEDRIAILRGNSLEEARRLAEQITHNA